MEKLILASGSPRRRELLTQIGIDFEVEKSNCEEVITCTEPGEIVMELSRQKAEEVASRYPEKLVLGADTIVCLDGKVMGKPQNEEDACRMLSDLSGKRHSVFTGVTLIRKERDGKTVCRSFYRETGVCVHEMSIEEIRSYVASGDPLDKAGAYGIQGPFAAYIDGIEGDYNNVVGLPVSAVYQELKDFC